MSDGSSGLMPGDEGEPVAPPVYASPEHEQAWETYRSHPDYLLAFAQHQARLRELQPLRDAVDAVARAWNDELTRSHLAFQATAHTPLHDLTATLNRLDAEHAERSGQ